MQLRKVRKKMGDRKLRRAQRFHTDRKCPECGSKLKYHKELHLYNKDDKAIKPEIIIHRDVFWYDNCKSVYGLPNRKG